MAEKAPFDPIHPAEILIEDYLKPTDTDAATAAVALGLPIAEFESFLNEHVGVTPDLAARLSRWIGCSEQFWLNLQKAYDDDVAGVPKRRIPVIGEPLAAE